MVKKTKLLEKVSLDLLKQLGFPETDVACREDEKDKFIIQIKVAENESGLLIGYHGETIFALQLVLSQIMANKTGSWNHIVVNIGDYREKREEALRNMALNSAQKVKDFHQAITLPYLNSSERRIIHLTLANDSEIDTYSEGIGKQRRLTIKPKSK